MRIARYVTAEGPRYGLIEGDSIAELAGFPALAPERTGQRRRLSEVRLLAPCEPSKVILLGQNYAAHALERGKTVPKEPRFFIKSATSVVGPGETIRVPYPEHRVDPEAELAVAIGREVRRASASEAVAAILGYTCGNDVSDRVFQEHDGHPTRGKSFDTFTPLGPWIVTDLDPSDLAIELRVNGELRQSSRTSQMLFSAPQIVAFVSGFLTLLPGDVILSGTPAGVAPMQPGDVAEVSIEGIGTLRNPVDRGARSVPCTVCSHHA
ncbi:MAG: fumarylacetoacetate hydrolase family protein [Chloroflexi bacterium]|nr:fumarylacetoacetate hydrolase family protein [Chloroflexota bacterium]